ncbi:MAG: putative DNA modification/repair radical SAM protein, partial [Clostridiales bacterium]|nr:putative DNA modification/repair radical SAM protein [Clostridiales bacterium]
CKYCVNRVSNDTQRATFTPEELAELTIEFYRRNYIEGLFLSSAVLKNADYTTERMIGVLRLLRYEHNFWGYIHAKVIPGTSPELVYQIGLLADRLSVNVELPSESSLVKLAPEKERKAIFKPMGMIKNGIVGNKYELAHYNSAPVFASAGQATQMIVGATEETDYNIVRLASGLYDKYSLKRVFYSAYIPAVSDKLLPAVDTKPPLLREHRLYQADWMLRMYQFKAEEILNEENPNFNPYMDPKCNWAINNMHYFPVDVNKASLETLLRVPGIGPAGARKIVTARRHSKLSMLELKRMGIVIKRARYFIITVDEKTGVKMDRFQTTKALIDPGCFSFGVEQMSIFDSYSNNLLHDKGRDNTAERAVEEAALCLASKL